MYRRIIVYTRIIITVSIRHSHGAVRCASVYSRQRRLRVTWCIIRLVFFFRFVFFRSAVHNIPIYITLLYYVYIRVFCVHHIIRSRCSFTFRSFSSHSTHNLLYYIGTYRWLFVPANMRSVCVCVCVCVCLYIIRAYGRKPGCAGETKQTPRGFQREGKKWESVILLLQRVVVGFGRSVCRRNDQKFTYIRMHVYYVTHYHDNCHILLYHTIFKVDSYYRLCTHTFAYMCIANMNVPPKFERTCFVSIETIIIIIIKYNNTITDIIPSRLHFTRKW